VFISQRGFRRNGAKNPTRPSPPRLGWADPAIPSVVAAGRANQPAWLRLRREAILIPAARTVERIIAVAPETRARPTR
jgi:hypothetical protein